MTKEARMVRIKREILELIEEEPMDVQVGAIGLAIVDLMEIGRFDHKLLTDYIDTQAEEIKRRAN